MDLSWYVLQRSGPPSPKVGRVPMLCGAVHHQSHQGTNENGEFTSKKLDFTCQNWKIGDLRIYHTEKLEYHDIVISSMDGFCMVLVGTPIFGNAHLTVVPFSRFLSFQCRFLKKSIRIVFLHLLSCILTWPMAVWRIPMFNNRADVHMEFVNGHVEFPIDI